MSTLKQCNYCYVNIENDNCLECGFCSNKFHIKCLKRPSTPGDFHGDIFFNFTCANCSTDGNEIFVRQKISWAILVVLAIYNLSMQSSGLSRNGYFHWRQHIASFIDKNWTFLMESNVRRRKKFLGSVSSSLSKNASKLFKSGILVFNEPGWWKLMHDKTPNEHLLYYNKLRNIDKKSSDETESNNSNVGDEICNSLINKDTEIFSRTLSYMGCHPRHLETTVDDVENIPDIEDMDWEKYFPVHFEQLEPLPGINLFDESYNQSIINNTNLMGSTNLANYKNDWSFNQLIGNIVDVNEGPASDHIETDDGYNDGDNDNEGDDGNNDNENNNDDDNDNDDDDDDDDNEGDDDDDDDDDIEDDDDEDKLPRIVQVTNFQEIQTDDYFEFHDNIIDTIKEERSESDTESYSYHCEESLFTKVPKRSCLPWEENNNDADDDDDDDDDDTEIGDIANNNNKNNNDNDKKNIELMSEYEEMELYKKLQTIINWEHKYNSIKIPTYVRRFYRKLHVRKLKRQLSKPIFDFDNIKGTDKCQLKRIEKTNQYLDRYHQQYHLISTVNKMEFASFHARLAGSTKYELFQSPHTGRILHPFIYRNREIIPQWVKLMLELQHNVNKEMPCRGTIDFCYVRAHHIAAVNGLLQQIFWPGIDMSECLSYPEYSVVALYKKLVVGCGFLVPDAGHNEAYISFLAVRSGWQRSGIATFMLYHLTQTCMGKDITLHVSATNPAICLYQKFGFKIEEVIFDFYDKFLPIDSPHSRHALFLRMKR